MPLDRWLHCVAFNPPNSPDNGIDVEHRRSYPDMLRTLMTFDLLGFNRFTDRKNRPRVEILQIRKNLGRAKRLRKVLLRFELMTLRS